MKRNILELAREKASSIPFVKGQSRHYAIITDKRGKIISEGSNDYLKTSTIMARASKRLGLEKEYIHAELNALLKDRFKKGYKLTVVRVNKKGELVNSSPCPVCCALIKQYTNIKAVEFSI